LLDVLNPAPGIAGSSVLWTAEKCNAPLFTDLARVHSLAGHAARLVVVSSAAGHALDKALYAIKNRHYISVPTHSRTRANEKYVSCDRPLPYVYKELREQIRSTAGPGDLVLVAAGVIGKIFLNDIRERGGVALDVGSSLVKWVDAWAGS
jgi:hypothetical protein